MVRLSSAFRVTTCHPPRCLGSDPPSGRMKLILQSTNRAALVLRPWLLPTVALRLNHILHDSLFSISTSVYDFQNPSQRWV